MLTTISALMFYILSLTVVVGIFGSFVDIGLTNLQSSAFVGGGGIAWSLYVVGRILNAKL